MAEVNAKQPVDREDSNLLLFSIHQMKYLNQSILDLEGFIRQLSSDDLEAVENTPYPDTPYPDTPFAVFWKELPNNLHNLTNRINQCTRDLNHLIFTQESK